MNLISIYTDGSHFKDKDFIGYGAYCVFEGAEFKMSGSVTQKAFKDFYHCEEAVSNPTAELVAATVVLRDFSKSRVPVNLEIVADYIGVKEWCEGKWKAKKIYIAKMLEHIQYSLHAINYYGGSVAFRHIPGHQNIKSSEDARANNEADLLAKSEEAINEFTELVELISNSVIV